MEIFGRILESENPILKREVYTGYLNLVKNCQETILWLKFDSNYFGIDSSNSISHIHVKGNP